MKNFAIVKPVRVEFRYTADSWTARLIYDATGRSTGLEVEHYLRSKSRDCAPLTGYQKAKADAERRHAETVFGTLPALHRFKTRADFEGWFLTGVKQFCLGYASSRRVIMVPVNYVERLCSVDQIRRLGKRLSRTRSDHSNYVFEVDGILLNYWLGLRFDEMDRFELAEWFRMNFPPVAPGKPLTANAIWQRAYNLSLFTKRSPGPKWRLKTTADPQSKHTL